jgi:hypothetical protein
VSEDKTFSELVEQLTRGLRALQTRANYLRLGGQWQMNLPAGLNVGARLAAEEAYRRGFDDAIRTLKGTQKETT